MITGWNFSRQWLQSPTGTSGHITVMSYRMWFLHHVLRDNQKPAWGTKWLDGTWQWQNVSLRMLSLPQKKQLSFHMKGGVAIWQFWLGTVQLSTAMRNTPNTGTKWMDLLIVLSSYCNTICSMAGHRGVCHQFDCADWIFMLSLFFPTLKSYFTVSSGRRDLTWRRLIFLYTLVTARPIALYKCGKLHEIENIQIIIV